VLDFHVWDEDDMGKNDSLGDAKLELETLFKTGEVFERPLPVYYKGKQHGRVNVKAYCKIMHPVQTEHKLVETETKLTDTTQQKAKVEKQLGAKEAELEEKFKEISALTSGSSDLKKKFEGLLSDLAVAEVSAKNIGERLAESEKNNHQLRERIEELKKQGTEHESKIKSLEEENNKQKQLIDKLEKEVKETKEKASKVEPRKTETKTTTTTTTPETKSTSTETKSDHKAEPAKELKVEEKDQKAVRKSSAARPSTLPGALAGKPAPEDWLVKVNLQKGIALRNAALFGMIDPFVEVTIQGLTSLSKTAQQTQNPEWNSKLNFFGEAGTTLPDRVKLVVRDSNKYTAATVIGETEIDLKQLWEKGTAYENTVEIIHKAKPAGKVVVQIACLFEAVTPGSEKPTS